MLWDGETDSPDDHYNYFRDYDPRTGRYAESDPIGLEGGINTYAYAYADPLRIRDPLGLAPPSEEQIGGGGGRYYIPPRPAPKFPGLEYHAREHGNGMTRGEYYQSAVNNMNRGYGMRIKTEGQWKTCYVTRIGPDKFQMTITAANDRVILTHYQVDSAYFGRHGIQLPGWLK